MKKVVFLILIVSIKISNTQAQWVTIPDPNFVTKLQQLFPTCMNGNQMDTTCAGIVNATTLNVSYQNISNLTGLEYFVNLNSLICKNNQLISLPTLPNSIDTLICSYNNLSSLPPLPNDITYLNCSANNLTTLPNLPNTIMWLSCAGNQLNSLPTLPSNLLELQCQINNLDSLPSLPALIYNLSCFDNFLINLPSIPSGLKSLACYNNQLTSIPNLPNSILSLSCFNNQLTNLPVLPDSIQNLSCSNNQLTSLQTLPDTMFSLNISGNNITCLSNLPQVNSLSVIYGDISNNPLTCVPNQTNYSLGLPLCLDNDPINNPNNCPVVTNVSIIENYDSTEEEIILIYPNPSNGIFLIKDNSNIQSIEVFNMMGERLLNQGKSNQINLNSYPKGIYFARINGQFMSKLVKE
jgi:Leucine-rich repeat (LRR) protein